MEMFALAFHLIIISWVHLFVVLGHAATVGEEYFQLDGNCGIFEPDIPRKQVQRCQKKEETNTPLATFYFLSGSFLSALSMDTRSRGIAPGWFR